MDRLMVGEYGFGLYLDTDLELDDSYDCSILVKKPDGTEEEWVAGIDPDSETKILYVVQEDDFDQPGMYILHAKVEGTGFVRLGTPIAIKAQDLFERSQ